MNRFLLIGAIGTVLAATPAAAVVVTSYTVNQGIAFNQLTGSHQPRVQAFTPFGVDALGRVTILLPKLNLLTRQTITRITIELVTNLANDPRGINRVTNGTGATKNYTIVSNATTSLSGTLGSTAGGGITRFGTTNSVTTRISQAGGLATDITYASANASNSFFRAAAPGINLNGLQVLAGGAASILTYLTPTGHNDTTLSSGSGAFQRQLKAMVNTTVRVHYESRAWVPNTDPPVPEPGIWMTMILGFGVIGAAMRRRRTVVAA